MNLVIHDHDFSDKSNRKLSDICLIKGYLANLLKLMGDLTIIILVDLFFGFITWCQIFSWDFAIFNRFGSNFSGSLLLMLWSEMDQQNVFGGYHLVMTNIAMENPLNGCL